VGQAQLAAWRSTGPGKHKPTAWVAASEELSACYYWPHTAFLVRLDCSKSAVDYPKLRMPDDRVEFPDVRGLVLHLLRNP